MQHWFFRGIPLSQIYNKPKLTIIEPMGVHFSLICFLVAMALWGSRWQKVRASSTTCLPCLISLGHEGSDIVPWQRRAVEGNATTIIYWVPLLSLNFKYYVNYIVNQLAKSNCPNIFPHFQGCALEQSRFWWIPVGSTKKVYLHGAKT